MVYCPAYWLYIMVEQTAFSRHIDLQESLSANSPTLLERLSWLSKKTGRAEKRVYTGVVLLTLAILLTACGTEPSGPGMQTIEEGGGNYRIPTSTLSHTPETRMSEDSLTVKLGEKFKICQPNGDCYSMTITWQEFIGCSLDTHEINLSKLALDPVYAKNQLCNFNINFDGLIIASGSLDTTDRVTLTITTQSGNTITR